MKRINDAQEGAKEPQKRSHTAGGGKPHQPLFQPAQFRGRAYLQRAAYGFQALDARLGGPLGQGGLTLDFAIARLENFRQGTLLQGAAKCSNLRQLLALPEYLEEFQRFDFRRPKDSEFSADDRPRENGKYQQHQQDKPGHGPRVRQKLPNFTLIEILRKTLEEN